MLNGSPSLGGHRVPADGLCVTERTRRDLPARLRVGLSKEAVGEEPAVGQGAGRGAGGGLAPT